jgi:methionyl aminopeptidase
MINLGHNWGDVHWPDNWTATTVDGKRSAQFEDTLLYVFINIGAALI